MKMLYLVLLLSLISSLCLGQIAITPKEQSFNRFMPQNQSFIDFSWQQKTLLTPKYTFNFGKYGYLRTHSPFSHTQFSYPSFAYQGYDRTSFILQPTMYNSKVELNGLEDGLSYAVVAFICDKLFGSK
jgi:hypothetical protein